MSKKYGETREGRSVNFKPPLKKIYPFLSYLPIDPITNWRRRPRILRPINYTTPPPLFSPRREEEEKEDFVTSSFPEQLRHSLEREDRGANS